MKYCDRFNQPAPLKWTGKYKTGLKPVTTQPTVRLADYYTTDLPTVDSLKYPLGHSDLIAPHMFLNDQLGDCAIAGSIEEVRLANALRGQTVNFTDDTARENYSAVTGYTPDDPGSDQGTDVHQLYEYRQTHGLLDADGNAHKVAGWAGLTVGDWDELLIALSLFQMVGIGIQVPDYAEQQFEAGQAWHLMPGYPNIIGQHYIPIVDAPSYGEAGVFTWGARTGITRQFYQQENVVAVVALTPEMFKDGSNAVDFEALAKDLPEFNTGPVMLKRKKAA